MMLRCSYQTYVEMKISLRQEPMHKCAFFGHHIWIPPFFLRFLLIFAEFATELVLWLRTNASWM